MKTIYVVNEKAGKKNDHSALYREIHTATEILGADTDIYITKEPRDATEFVKKVLKDNPKTRFIACGGDGTLGEVVSGTIGYPEAEVGVIPIGTGNDFCRNFSDEYDFCDVWGQITGEASKCDAIKVTIKNGDDKKVRYSANMINIGFDANVAYTTDHLREKTFLAGPFSYFAAILVNIVTKKGAKLEVTLDDKVMHKGNLLLSSVANGCYCGGGIKSNPMAILTDGLLNVNIIKDIKRYQFIGLLPHYMKGTHMGIKGIEKIITSHDAKNVRVKTLSESFKISIDGEIYEAEECEFEVLEKAFSFVTPFLENDLKNKEKKDILNVQEI